MPAINSANNRFLNQPVITTAVSYTASINDVIIEVSNTTAARTITLPSPSSTGNVGKAFLIKDTSGTAATNNITITPTSGTIDAQASVFIASNYGSVQIFCDGTNYYSYGISPTGSFIVKNQAFTSSGTYTPTSGMLYCEVVILGGGGAGGGAPATAASQLSVGSGGGAGEYAVGYFSSSQIGGSQVVTIGAGGAGSTGAAGAMGGTTSLGSLMTAFGGKGGASNVAGTLSSQPGSLGGTGGSGGNYRTPGGPGGFSEYSSGTGVIFAGQGGASQIGAGGIVNNPSAAGAAGLGYGSGGSGASNGASQSALAGGAGASGMVLITEYIATASANLPSIALAKASWNRQSLGSSTGFTPGATVIQIGFTSDPGSTPSNSGSRIDLSSLTQNEGSNLIISQFQVTMTQGGTYQIIGNSAFVYVGGANFFLQCVKNSTTVLALGVCQVASAPWVETASFVTTAEFAVGDVIDFRVNSPQSPSGVTFASISLAITQVPSSTIVPLSSWNAVAGTSQTLVSNTNYFTQNASLTTFTLPLAANAGSVIEIAGNGTGGWTIAQNAGQSMVFGNRTTTTGTGGSISSTNQNDAIRFVCIVANTQWNVLQALGNLTIV